MTFKFPPSFDEIVTGQIYLGNLAAALCPEVQSKLGTTHIVSVCPEYASTGPHHLTIAVDDSEYDDLLIHFPETCQFIQAALDSGGKVFVHCIMGISRSATVVAAYLMKTCNMTRSSAINFIKKRRPQVHPNYGFVKQLEIFAECDYNPTPTNPIYCKWKLHRRKLVTQFLNQMIDTTPILSNKLLLSSEFPDDPWQAESLVLDAGITHLLYISPAQIPSTTFTLLKGHHHIKIPEQRQAELLLSLSEACRFIETAIESGGQVLVHSLVESTACIVVCAFLMFSQELSPDAALALLEDALPLFNPTASFSRHLELFAACNYHPTSDNPLVEEWVEDAHIGIGAE